MHDLVTSCKQLHALSMGHCQWLIEKLIFDSEIEVEQRVEQLKSLNWHIREKFLTKILRGAKV
jgi:hypothetical protein